MHAALAGLPLGAVHVFMQIGSTNDEAARLAEAGAPDLTLVTADEQTAGRGRAGRRWFTPPGSALAVSLVLRPSRPVPLGHYAALGALAVCRALGAFPRVEARIKWPNDVLLHQVKVAGVLPEAHWEGDTLRAVVLGIGVNVTPKAVPPPEVLDFPATCVAQAVGRAVSRLALLREIVEGLLYWRARLGTADFLRAWEDRLAYRGAEVWVTPVDGAPWRGVLLGLDAEGRLRVRDERGRVRALHQVAHLRPVAVTE